MIRNSLRVEHYKATPARPVFASPVRPTFVTKRGVPLWATLLIAAALGFLLIATLLRWI